MVTRILLIGTREKLSIAHTVENLEEIEADNLGGNVDDGSRVDNLQHGILSVPSKFRNTSIMMVMFHFRLCSSYLGTPSSIANPPGGAIQPMPIPIASLYSLLIYHQILGN